MRKLIKAICEWRTRYRMRKLQRKLSMPLGPNEALYVRHVSRFAAFENASRLTMAEFYLIIYRLFSPRTIYVGDDDMHPDVVRTLDDAIARAEQFHANGAALAKLVILSGAHELGRDFAGEIEVRGGMLHLNGHQGLCTITSNS